MKVCLKLLSVAGLMLTLLPSILVFSGHITLMTNKWLMLVGTLLWFFSAPFWMNREA